MYDSELINGEEPIVSLSGSDLRGIVLSEVLQEGYVSEVLSAWYLSNLDLSMDHFSEAERRVASYRRTPWIYLYYFEPKAANLSGAVLLKASMRRCDLSNADLSSSFLQDADLQEAQLNDADLRNADLSRACLVGANLVRADLRKALLEDTDLSGALLWETDLREARELRQDQVNQAIGNGTTLLPEELEPPEIWSEGFEVQYVRYLRNQFLDSAGTVRRVLRECITKLRQSRSRLYVP